MLAGIVVVEEVVLMETAAVVVDIADSYSNTIVDIRLQKTSDFRILDINPYFQPSPM